MIISTIYSFILYLFSLLGRITYELIQFGPSVLLVIEMYKHIVRKVLGGQPCGLGVATCTVRPPALTGLPLALSTFSYIILTH